MARLGTVTQYTHYGHKTVGEGVVMCSPHGGPSTGMDRRKVVMCPHRGIDILGPKSRCWGGAPPLRVLRAHLDAPGQQRGQLPSSVWTRHRAEQ